MRIARMVPTRAGNAAAAALLVGCAATLAGCGHSESGPPTLSVSCDGSLMLAGAASVSASSTNNGSRASLSFPDPANPGQTGTLPIDPGRACVITAVAGSGKGDTDAGRAAAAGH